jgi:hypothetical protein
MTEEKWDFYKALGETIQKQYVNCLLISETTSRFSHLQKDHDLVYNPMIPATDGRLIKIKGYYVFKNDELIPVDPLELEKEVGKNERRKTEH